ncbi:MAG: putative AP-2 complex subunit alpha, partial [Streblomastix strix]
MHGTEFRGLVHFISDIRFCSTREEEINRVEKELAHIREEFINPKKLDVYARKKFILKLMYISILGYSVDFGHIEAMELLHSTKFEDKQVGYTVLGAFVNERSELLRLMSQQLLSDLTSKHETHNTLALCFIANSGNAETGETLGNNVSKILMQQNARPYVIKKAALCLLHLFRKNADVVGPPANFVEKAKTLLQHTDAGVLTAVLSLIQGLAAAAAKEYEILIPLICKLLNKVVIQKAVTVSSASSKQSTNQPTI